MRICSLLPGATEVVAALGAADQLVGISHECDFPPEVIGKPVLVRAVIDAERTASADIDRQVRETLNGGHSLYRLDESRFHATRPDVVLTQDLCAVCAVTPDQLRQAIADLTPSPRVVSLNPTRLDDVIADVERIGAAIGKTEAAEHLAAALRGRLTSIRDQVSGVPGRPRVACLEWLDPLYVGGHWVPEMVTWAGGQDVLGTPGAPSRRIAWTDLIAAAPEIVVLMPCGFTVDRTLHELHALTAHPDWVRLPAVSAGRVYAVEAGAFFSRPGPRLIDGVRILAALFHPERFDRALPPGARRLEGAPR
ncbi:cobalamin-binding protein [Candidatus Nitrospira bockiana]